MAFKPMDVPINDMITDYLAGNSLRSVALKYGVKDGMLLKRFKKMGVAIEPRRKVLPDEEIIAAYASGMGIVPIGKRYNVAPSVIRIRLKAHGIPLRTQSEQEQEKWRQMSPEQRYRQTAAANAAARGRKATLETLLQKAQTLQGQGRMTRQEAQIHYWLRGLEIDTIPQQAIGPYNCDLGAFPVAVEVFGGNWHWHGRHAERLAKRLHYILHAGWSVMAVHINQMYRPLLYRAAEEIATYVKRVRSNPALIGEYRMIRGTGEFVAALRPESDDFANILTLTRPLYPGGKHAS